MNHIQEFAMSREQTVCNQSDSSTDSSRRSANAAVLSFEGRIVFGSRAASFADKIARTFPGACRMVLDLSRVEMIDGTGLGELVVAWMWAQAHGCSVKLAAPSRRIRQILELTHLTSVFEVHPTVEEALRAFSAEAVPQ